MIQRFFLLIASFAVVAATVNAQLQPSPSVDTFTGAFRCSVPVLTVPGPHGSDYTIVLNYDSDVRAEDEASWVGYGWSLEAPAIHRIRKGLPDDMKKREVRYSEGGGFSERMAILHGNDEILSFNLGLEMTPGLSGSLVVSCNPVSGYDAFVGFGPNLGLKVAQNLSLSLGGQVDSKGRYGLSASFRYRPIESASVSGLFASYNPRAKQSPVAGLVRPFNGTVLTNQASVRFGKWELGADFITTEISFKDYTIASNGYLYSSEVTASGTASNEQAMDYLVEREHASSRDDTYTLPIPLPANDEFSVSAPGVSGVFRAHLPLPLRARPTTQSSELDNKSHSLKVVSGQTSGVGIGTAIPIPASNVSTSGGFYPLTDALTNETKAWLDSSLMVPFFRFIDDPADEVRYSSTNEIIGTGIFGMSRGAYHPINRGRLPRMNRAIEYRTVAELQELAAITVDADRKRAIKSAIPASDIVSSAPESIATFSITNEIGATTEFGIPVYSRWESSASFSKLQGPLKVARPPDRVVYPGQALRHDDTKEYSKKSMNYPYAYAWYASAIYTSNYIDVNGNGPDASDAGGWTKFKYTDPVDRWWRSPYNGYWLDRRDVDDYEDDVLSVASGSQQVRFLREVETATHVAVIYTSWSESTAPKRVDTQEPTNLEPVASSAPSSRSLKNPLPYIHHITLYKKNGTTRVALKTVYFSYDYSLAPKNPSSMAINGSQAGKLTLRRIWSEERNVKEATIQPVDFFYQYPTTGSGAATTSKDQFNTGVLSTRFGAVASIPNPSAQNPDFDANKVDAWGFMMGTRPLLSDAASSMDAQQYAPPHLWQSSGAAVDPGMWRLRTIRLPSGARIVPVYERRTYDYVQDKRALTMTPLDQSAGDASRRDNVNQVNAFRIDPVQVGLSNTDPTEVGNYVTELSNKFVSNGEPMYFRFAYNMFQCGTSGPVDQFYVRGYGKVTSCSTVAVVEGGTTKYKIEVKIGPMNDPGLGTLALGTIEESQKGSPFSIALKYWKSFLRGRCWCNGEGDVGDLLASFINMPALAYNNLAELHPDRFPRIVPTQSSLRLPMARPKAGGGCRVAKMLVLSPDGSLEAGDVGAVGAEYTYGEKNGEGQEVASWGVATNEPELMREENAVVGIDPLFWYKATEHILDDEFLAKMEGPVGYSMLPSPSIGYSKIVVQPLNRQANTTGYSITKFITAKDVPSLITSQSKVERGKNDLNDPPIVIPMFQKSTMDVELMQGFSIRQCPYHGLVSSTEQYSGVYLSTTIPNRLMSSTQLEYVMPGDIVETYSTNEHSLRSKYSMDHMDLVHEVRQYDNKLNLWRVDLTYEMLGVVPLFGVAPSYNGIDHQLKTAVTTNFLRHTPILKRTISMIDGRRDTTEIVAFDLRNGMAAITRATDSYQGSNAPNAVPTAGHNSSIISISIPAMKQYASLGNRSEFYRKTFAKYDGKWPRQPVFGEVRIKTLTSSDITLACTSSVDQSSRVAFLASEFTVGDELLIYDGAVLIAHVLANSSTGASVSGSDITIPFTVLAGSTSGTVTSPRMVVAKSARKNFIAAGMQQTAYYGLDVAAAVQRARDLRAFDGTCDMLNNWARNGAGSINALYGTPLCYKATPSSSALCPPSGGGTTACVMASSAAGPLNPLSKFEAGLLVLPTTPYVRIGILNPEDAATLKTSTISNCGGHVDPFWQVCGYPWTLPVCNDEVWSSVAGLTTPTTPSIAPPRAYADLPFDEWTLFYAGDKATLTLGTFPPSPTQSDAGTICLNGGGYSSVLPAAATTARILGSSVTSWQSYEVTVLGGQTGRQWLPVTKWTWVSQSTTDASGVNGTPPSVFEAAGTMPTATPPTNTMLNSPASATAIPSSGTGWLRSSIVVAANQNGQPLRVDDIYGVSSVVQYDAAGLVAQASFSNAKAGNAWYESFEMYSSSTRDRALAFTGVRACTVSTTGTVTVNRPAQSLTGSTGETVVLRMWLRPSALTSSSPSLTSVTVNGISLVDEDVLATVDGWSLIETRRTYTSGAGSVSITSPSFALLVDDLIVHSITSTSAASVVDDELRPIAAFGDDHFPTVLNYDARGGVGTVVQTGVNGHAALASSGGNVPKRIRSAAFTTGGPTYGESALRMRLPGPLENASDASILPDELESIDSKSRSINAIPAIPSGLGGKASLLELNAAPDRIQSSTIIDKFRTVAPVGKTAPQAPAIPQSVPLPVKDSLRSSQRKVVPK